MKIYDGQSVNDHCLTMIKDIEELQKLGINMDKKFQLDLILQSVSNSYEQFIMNYHMNKIDSTFFELLNMLVIVEDLLKSSRDIVLTVERTFSKKKSSFEKKKSVKKQKNETKPKKQVSKKAGDKEKYFHCNVEDH